MLTAADVLNHKFSATKFREGYDQDEVDAVLDRVCGHAPGRSSAARALPAR